MNDVRTLVVQLAVAKAVSQQCGEVIAAVKDQLEAAMDPGDRKTAKVGGHDVGTVSYAKTSKEVDARVTDSDALTTWVVANRPDWLDYQLTLDARDVGLALSGDAGATARVLGFLNQRALHPRISQSALDLLLAGCRKAEAPVIPDTGEEVPGVTVTVTPGGEGKYVSARISEAQMGALIDAYQEGHLDLLALATVPPQIEAADDGR